MKFNEFSKNFKWNSFSYEVQRIFERSIILIKMIIQAVLRKTAKIHVKYRWQQRTFMSKSLQPNKSSQRSEKSYENSLYKQCPKTDVNLVFVF